MIKHEKLSKKEKEEKIRKSLIYSTVDGSFYSIMVGFGESFFSAFAVFLKATSVQIGLLGSLPLAIGSLLQLLSTKLLHLFGSRKRMICTFAFLQALMHIPILLVFFFGTFKILHLIIFVSLYFSFAMIAGPAWNSWMGDLVKEKERGIYFGQRNRIAGFASFSALLLAGYLLQQFGDGTKTQYIGFAIVFSIALIARLVSFYYLTKKYEPEYKISKRSNFTFLQFIEQARKTNYGLLVLYLTSMSFAIFLAAPFFVVYMLQELNMNYIQFTVLTGVMILVKYLFMPTWGKLSDKFGTRKVLSLAGFLMPITPILWLFSTNFWYLFLIQIYSGFVWAGFEIASFNFIFDTTSPEKRTTCVAYYNVLNGIMIISGAIVGGLIAKYNTFFWSPYLLVFLISGIIRYLVSIIFIPKLKEVREVKHIQYPRLLYDLVLSTHANMVIYKVVTLRKDFEGLRDGIKNKIKKDLNKIKKKIVKKK